MSSDRHIDYQGKFEHPRGETYTRRMRQTTRAVVVAILALILLYLVLLFGGYLPGPPRTPHGHAGVVDDAAATVAPGGGTAAEPFVPDVWAVFPFVVLLLSIALLPLIRTTHHWWERNRNKFVVAAGLGLLTLCYYGLIHAGGVTNHLTHHVAERGWATVGAVASNALLAEFVPFIILLFSLYVISGGIHLSGDLPAHPRTNCTFLGVGALLASFIGTTGAAMILIRPLLETNKERKYKVHTVVFFIFTVCNCGGLLLPIGDPPLFLGYLKGVPFLWTLGLLPYWVGMNAVLLVVYYLWDRRVYSREQPMDLVRDETAIRPLRLSGGFNLLLLLGVALCAAMVVPNKAFAGTTWCPPKFFREAMMLVLVVCSLVGTSVHTRVANRFDYVAITEVACLFIGIFMAMQAPIEILNARGAQLGLVTPGQFFWASGVLSSFLDNAPTYVVFFETANALTHEPGPGILQLLSLHYIREDLLTAISLGSVFMGANTYIGNGPNFMVKSIAEQSGVKMPSFFGYMMYSVGVLIPIFVVVTFLLR